jgi:uncharacterized membrane protein
MAMAEQMQSPTSQGSSGGGGSGLAPNVASLLAYLCTFVTGIIFLLIEKDNKEVKFHAWQAILLGAGAIALEIGLAILTAIMGAISGILATLFSILGTLVWLALIGVWIICMYKAYQGQHFKLPFIGDIADKQAAK